MPKSNTPKTCTNSETCITLKDLEVLINKSKDETIRTLQKELKAQSRDFQKHVDGLSLTIERLQDSLTSVKSSISEQNTKISHLLQRIEELDAEKSQLQRRCNKLEGDYLDLPTALLEEFEDRTRRRKNILISGVQERNEGSAEERIVADREHVESILQELSEEKGFSADEIARCHRVGRQSTGKARPLRVVLQDEETKRSILSNAKRLRNTASYKNVYVNPDLTFSQRKANQLLREELKRRRNENEDVIIRRNKIVVRRENFQ